MKKVFFFLISLLTAFFFQTSSVRAENLNFPIAELGNCRDQRECYFYCEVPQNKPSCWSYGKFVLPNVLGEETTDLESLENDAEFTDLDKDLSKLEAEVDTQDEQKLMEEKARQHGVTFPIKELGDCTNYQECRAYCDKPENQERCITFAKKKGFYKKSDDSSYAEVEKKFLQKAKEILGCSTKEECLQFCDKPENHARCEQFAKRHGLYRENKQVNKEEQSRRMEKARSLGCDSEESCRKFCSEHPTECPGYPTIQRLSPLPGREYVKPSWYPQTTHYPQATYYPQITYYPQPTYIYSTGYPTYYQQPVSNSNYSYPTGYLYPPTTNSSYTSNTTY